jgi:hypothetical protein
MRTDQTAKDFIWSAHRTSRAVVSTEADLLVDRADMVRHYLGVAQQTTGEDSGWAPICQALMRPTI